MRMEKLKSRASLVGALKHDYRERVPENADPERTDKNVYDGSVQSALAKYSEKLPEKVRKNAVHAVEIVLTASPEWFEKADHKQIDEFIQRSQGWCAKLFGYENELAIALHMDEKTPHIHAIYMPLVDGKLNSKAVIGGSRDRMRALQDDFYKKVGKPLGMDRGEKREAVRHTEVSEFGRVLKEKESELARKTAALEKSKELWKGKLEKGDFDTGLYLGEVFHSLSKAQIKECWAVTKAHADGLREQNKKIQTPSTPERPRGRSR